MVKSAAAVLLPFCIVVHGIELLSRAVYGRGLDLVFDLAQVPNVLNLLAQSMGWLIVGSLSLFAFLLMLGIVIGSAILGVLLVDSSIRGENFRPHMFSRPTQGIAGFTALVLSIGIATPDLFGAYSPLFGVTEGEEKRPLFTRFASWMEADRHVRIGHAWIDGGASVEAMYAEQRGEVEDGKTVLPGLRNTDITLIFVESYGASLLERPSHLEALTNLYTNYEKGFIEDGRKPVSSLVQSPTYGGLSWLAHLSTLAGAWIDENLEYRVFLQSPFDTLPKILRRSGYESLLFMPGIRGFWPEGKLLGFDQVYAAKDMGYGGIEFGYFAIPDQFTLERAAEILRTRAAIETKPRFTQITLITSHYPFRPLPPRIDAQEKILQDDVWAIEAETAGSFALEDWDRPEDGYIAGIEYSLRAAFDYAARHTDKDDLVIIMGDHQPWTFVSGGLGGRSSPIHVITGNEDLKRCFLSDGYRAGLNPNRETALYGMDWILQRLVAHFGENAPGPCAPPLQ